MRMKKKNKWLALLLALIMTLCLAVACGSPVEETEEPANNEQVEMEENASESSYDSGDDSTPNAEELQVQEEQEEREKLGIEEELTDG